jgi:hypothetical protein
MDPSKHWPAWRRSIFVAATVAAGALMLAVGPLGPVGKFHWLVP